MASNLIEAKNLVWLLMRLLQYQQEQWPWWVYHTSKGIIAVLQGFEWLEKFGLVRLIVYRSHISFDQNQIQNLEKLNPNQSVWIMFLKEGFNIMGLQVHNVRGLVHDFLAFS